MNMNMNINMNMKKLVCVLSVLLVMAALPALADSIAPTSVTATLAPGASTTVHKTVTVTAGTPTSSLVDVYFLADTTGSMGGVIGAVSAAATAILTSTAGLGDVKFAVGEYKDQPSTDPTSAYAYHLNTAMTSSVAAATAGINLWSAGGGATSLKPSFLDYKRWPPTRQRVGAPDRPRSWFGWGMRPVMIPRAGPPWRRRLRH